MTSIHSFDYKKKFYSPKQIIFYETSKITLLPLYLSVGI